RPGTGTRRRGPSRRFGRRIRACRAPRHPRAGWALSWRTSRRKAAADMCIGIPGKILAIREGLMPMADLDFGGTARECCLAYVPEARVGDYVLIQNGFA